VLLDEATERRFGERTDIARQDELRRCRRFVETVVEANSNRSGRLRPVLLQSVVYSLGLTSLASVWLFYSIFFLATTLMTFPLLFAPFANQVKLIRLAARTAGFCAAIYFLCKGAILFSAAG